MMVSIFNLSITVKKASNASLCIKHFENLRVEKQIETLKDKYNSSINIY